MKKIVLLFCLSVLLFSSVKQNLVQFGTGVSYLFIAKDKNGSISFIDDSNAILKHDGSYCYLSDKVLKNYENLSNIPDKLCKNLPPNHNIIKVLNPIKNINVFWPFDNEEHFDLPKNLPDNIKSFLDEEGIIANKVKPKHEVFIVKNHHIDLKIDGGGYRSRGYCSANVSLIISLKIDNIQILKDLYTNPCSSPYNIRQIDIDVNKKLIILHIRKYSADTEDILAKIPLDYFKSISISYLFDEDSLQKIIDYLNTNSKTSKDFSSYYSYKIIKHEKSSIHYTSANIDNLKPKKVKKYSIEKYEKKCDNNQIKYCYDLGIMYYYGYNAKQDKEKAFNFFNKSCNGKFAKACYNLANIYNDGYGVKVDRKKAVLLYQKACDSGYGEACYHLGNMKLFKDKDLMSAKDFFRLSCQYGYKRGCFAPMFWTSDRDIRVDIDFLKNLCSNNNILACINLGNIYSDGVEIKKDPQKALSFYKKACDRGSTVGCFELGVLYDVGDGVKKDQKKALKLYEKTCDNGYSYGCYNLGLMYDGYGMFINRKKAKILYKKACKLGNLHACKKLKKKNGLH